MSKQTIDCSFLVPKKTRSRVFVHSIIQTFPTLKRFIPPQCQCQSQSIATQKPLALGIFQNGPNHSAISISPSLSFEKTSFHSSQILSNSLI
jgi:hypothetical protein